MPSEQHLEVLHQVFDGFNRHDVDAIMSYFADDCVLELPRGPDRWGRRFVGKDEAQLMVRRSIPANRGVAPSLMPQLQTVFGVIRTNHE